MSFLTPSAGSTFGLVLRVALIGSLCALVGYATWKFAKSDSERDKQTAVALAYKDASDKIAAEHKLYSDYRAYSDQKFGAVMELITANQKESAARDAAIASELSAYKVFYSQPLPDSGYLLWQSARRAFERSSQSLSLPPSQPLPAAIVKGSVSRTSARKARRP